MKMLNLKKMKQALLCGVLGLTALLCAAFAVSFTEVKASAATLTASQYQTNGASVRIFKKNVDGSLEETTRSGIRFHVEMGAGYQYNGTTLINTEEINAQNGSFKLADGFKTYTLILPSNMLGNADLTVDTPSVMKLNTSEYWYNDADGNHESVAYVYNVPVAKYTQTFAFRGIICTVAQDGTETVVAQTDVADRQLCYVAKEAYKATIDTNSIYWGRDEAFDAVAAEKIKTFIPTCTITYDVDGVKTTEDVLWGDAPKSVPMFDVPEVDKENGQFIEYTAAWYNTADSQEIDVTKTMAYEQDCAITLTHATSAEFKLTGVADYNNFRFDTNGDKVVDANDDTLSGIKVYATLPVDDFEAGTKLDTHAVKVVHTSESGGKFNGLQGVWTLQEGSQMRLVFAFDSSNMKNGDKLTIKGDSVFYANNVMYTLTEDYVIDYTCNAQGEEDYGMFLGYLHNSDITIIQNWIEPTDTSRRRIRVTFYDDLLINSDFTLVFDGELPAEYAYPAYTKCNDTDEVKPITKGYYYWNNGEHTILELEGFAEHNNDELFGVPGIKIVQNGGYYIFEDAMYAYFNGAEWVVGAEKGTFGANAFEWKGWNATDTTEARFTTNANTALTAGGTTDRWFNEVYQMTAEHMSKSEQVPYAVYCTNPDGTVQPINDFIYHGQPTDTAYNHIFAFRGFEGTQAGQVVTIVGGTRFWCGNEYFTASETINFYYNGIDWIANHNGDILNEVTESNFNGQSYNFLETRDGKETNNIRIHFNSEMFNGATGEVKVEKGSVKINGTAYTNLYYHGSGNKIFEVRSFETSPLGKNAFADTLVIEAGTRVWLNDTCLKFTEELQWIFAGEEALRNGSGTVIKYHWLINKNTNISVADIINTEDYMASGEVRFKLKDGILSDDFYGYVAVNTEKGVPVANGKEIPNASFSYGQTHNLIAVREGEYARDLGDYIIIPKGSEWWTTQGKLTFLEEIYAVWNDFGKKCEYGFNTEDEIGSISLANVEDVLNEGSNEIRVKINKGISDTYYGPIAIKGQATVTKTDGTVNSVFGHWYGGASGSYTANHSLIGFRGTNISAATEGDVFTVKAGTKLMFRAENGIDGYRVIAEDLVYTFVNGQWKQGNLNVTATYTADHATVSGATEVIVGKTYTFTVTPDNNYTVSAVTVNGNALIVNGNNSYTFTAAATNEIVVTTVEGYSVKFSIAEGITVDDGAITNGMSKAVAAGDSLTFKVAANSGYRLGTVSGATDNGDGTYTVSAATTVSITSVKQWKVTYSMPANVTATFNGGSVPSEGIVVDQGTYTAEVSANAGYVVHAVSANGTPLTGSNGVYSVAVNEDVNLTATVVDPINVDNSKIISADYYQENSLRGIRIALDKSIAEIAAITGGNYGTDANVIMTGNVSLTIGGNTEALTAAAYSYFGKIDETQYQLLEVRFDTTQWVNGDELVIEAGTYFYLPAVDKYIYFDEAYSVENCEVTLSGSNFTVISNRGYLYNGERVDAETAISSGAMVLKGTVLTVSAAAYYDITAVDVTGAADNGNYQYTVNSTTTIQATTKGYCTVKFTTENGATYSVTSSHTTTTTDTYKVYCGETITFTARDDDGINKVTADTGTVSGSGPYSYTVGNTAGTPCTITITGKSCITGDTLITLADGTQKRADQLNGTEMLLVWNHFTGQMETAPIAYIVSHGNVADETIVTRMNFSDGSYLDIIGEHVFYDATLNKYVAITSETVSNYIGHSFIANNETNNGLKKVELVSFETEMRVTTTYEVVTYKNITCFTGGILSASAYLDPLLNHFDINVETFAFEDDAVRADIEEYGLYTYADFEELITEEAFELYNAQYLKIAVGKGYITWDDILEMIDIYFDVEVKPLQ